MFSLLATVKKTYFLSILPLVRTSNDGSASSFRSKRSKQTGSFISRYLLPYFSQLYRRDHDEFDHQALHWQFRSRRSHHKTESNKIAEPCAFLPALRYTGSSDVPSDIVARGNDDRGRTSTENGKGREGERSSEWMARYRYEIYRLYHRVRLHHPPFSLLPTPFYSYAPSTAHLVGRTTHRVCARPYK